MNKKQEIIRGHLTCTCDEAYKSRNLTDPNCFLCEYESEIELMMEEYAQQQVKNLNIPAVSNFVKIALLKQLEDLSDYLPCEIYTKKVIEIKSNFNDC